MNKRNMLISMCFVSLAIFGSESDEGTPAPQAAEQTTPSLQPQHREESEDGDESELEDTVQASKPIPNIEVEHEIHVGSEKDTPMETPKPKQKKTIWQWLKGL